MKMQAKVPSSIKNAAPRPKMERAVGTTLRDHPKHPIEHTEHSPSRHKGNMGKGSNGC